MNFLIFVPQKPVYRHFVAVAVLISHFSRKDECPNVYKYCAYFPMKTYIVGTHISLELLHLES